MIRWLACRTPDPATARARRAGVRCEGPFPADGLFAKAGKQLPYDAVLAMYHDQGLVAAKALDFEATVNVTLGLPSPRTSPDHGTAYDIAGRGIASAEPMIEALLTAARLAGKRQSPGRPQGRSDPGRKPARP
jgi:4-hydroxythreonine-4-phosphate dehydrogenase